MKRKRPANLSHFLRNNFTGRHARSSCDVSRGAAAVLSQLIWANLHYEFSKPSVNLGATSWKNLTTKAPPPLPFPIPPHRQQATQSGSAWILNATDVPLLFTSKCYHVKFRVSSRFGVLLMLQYRSVCVHSCHLFVSYVLRLVLRDPFSCHNISDLYLLHLRM